MDLADYTIEETSEKGAVMDITNVATGDVIHMPSDPQDENSTPKKMWIRFRGWDSPTGRRENAKINNRSARRGDNYIPSDDDQALEKKHDAMSLSKMVIEGEVYFEKEWIELTAENAYKVFHRSTPLRAQSLRFLNDPKNWLDNPGAKTS